MPRCMAHSPRWAGALGMPLRPPPWLICVACCLLGWAPSVLRAPGCIRSGRVLRPARGRRPWLPLTRRPVAFVSRTPSRRRWTMRWSACAKCWPQATTWSSRRAAPPAACRWLLLLRLPPVRSMRMRWMMIHRLAAGSLRALSCRYLACICGAVAMLRHVAALQGAPPNCCCFLLLPPFLSAAQERGERVPSVLQDAAARRGGEREARQDAAQGTPRRAALRCAMLRCALPAHAPAAPCCPHAMHTAAFSLSPSLPSLALNRRASTRCWRRPCPLTRWAAWRRRLGWPTLRPP